VATTAWDLARLTAPPRCTWRVWTWATRAAHARPRAFSRSGPHAGRAPAAGRAARLPGPGGSGPVSDGLRLRRGDALRPADGHLQVVVRNQLRQHRTPCFSLSADGTRVEGWTPAPGAPLGAAGGEPAIEERLRRSARGPARLSRRLEARAREALGELARDLARLEGLARRGLELAGRLARGDRRTAEELNGVDAEILRLAPAGGGFLFQPLIRRILGGVPAPTARPSIFRRAVRELSASAGYQAALIRQALERGAFPKAGAESSRNLE